jgi:fatty-acid desaturase
MYDLYIVQLFATTEALRTFQCIQFIQLNSITYVSNKPVSYISSQIELRSLAVILYLHKYYTHSKFSGKPLLQYVCALEQLNSLFTFPVHFSFESAAGELF